MLPGIFLFNSKKFFFHRNVERVLKQIASKPSNKLLDEDKGFQGALKQTGEALITAACLVSNLKWGIVLDLVAIGSSMKIAVLLKCPENVKKSHENIKDWTRMGIANH